MEKARHLNKRAKPPLEEHWAAWCGGRGEKWGARHCMGGWFSGKVSGGLEGMLLSGEEVQAGQQTWKGSGVRQAEVREDSSQQALNGGQGPAGQAAKEPRAQEGSDLSGWEEHFPTGKGSQREAVFPGG